MTLAYWMVLVAMVLPYLCVALAKWRKNYDNHAPRKGIDALEPRQQRAYWAHLNAFEAFAPFAAAVIIAHLCGAPQRAIDALALTFVAARVAHVFCYWHDYATARSVAWTVGFGCVIALFVIAA